ncbi:flavin-dependent monooxygenase [Croceicoccus sp. F390]|uniref:Flavin-dependent monooxygenase n=1 Tax=Croceicoccus esteveae TaxID=3075597 RepID=A0ABU2ZFZ0_9SPHN|nr:flavin-dependent monooxygenase [Croceicoccus sp. F390]MDT0575224.1 flavin-dependent monooxygenase [Croceicoccus sp. F390]
MADAARAFPTDVSQQTGLTGFDEALAVVAQNSQKTREQRKVADESIEALRKTGFMRALLPARWGGLEMRPQDFFRAQVQVAEADMSTAWAGGIIAVHPFQIALMDERAQHDVFADNPDTYVSSSYNPVGAKVEQVDGGVMLSGRWGWSSGSEHCTWALLGGVVAGEGYRTFLVPRSDYEIEDTWFSMGLQGTGSNDVVIAEPVFVPDYRSHKQVDGFNGVHNQESALYDLPWAQVFIRVVSSASIGAVKHALSLFMENSANSSTDATKMQNDPDITRRLAEVRNLVSEVESVMYANFDAMMDLLEAGKTIPIEDRVLYRYQASLVIEKMIKAVDLLFDVAGGRSVFTGSPIQQLWNDVHIGRAHVANNPVGFGRNLGGVMLGGENKDMFI